MDSEAEPKVELILYDSYVQTVKNSPGSRLFKNLYAYVGGKRQDIVKNGILSCATFVSSILYLHKLIADSHATIAGTIKDLRKSGWREIAKPRIGAVLVWEAVKFKDGSSYRHIGFYMAKGRAISNNTSRHQPAAHHWTFGLKKGQPVRKVEQIFWHPKLEHQ